MSESKIPTWLHSHNILVSAGTISNMLVKNKDIFHQEKADIFTADLVATPLQQIDDIAARFKGQNYHTHVIGNPFYTAYFTTPPKNRLTVLEILNGNRELSFCLNNEAFDVLNQLNVAQKHIFKLLTEELTARARPENGMSASTPCPVKELRPKILS